MGRAFKLDIAALKINAIYLKTWGLLYMLVKT
jgi:hypothetical protein